MPVELNTIVDSGNTGSSSRIHHDLWPLDEIDSKAAKFPCCIVWIPLPVVSWLAPYMGHVGICCENGAVLNFAGSNFVNEGNFAYGPVARYLQLDREQCCFPSNLAAHSCTHAHRHADHGTALSWDDVIHSSMQQFQHKYYNLFTCNCHSFVANCLNRLSYDGPLGWNVVNVAALILWKGRWVDSMSVVRSFFPFVTVLCIGILMAGWPFLIGLVSFSFLLIGWFLFGTYCMKNLID